jgi:hypothetical protein
MAAARFKTIVVVTVSGVAAAVAPFSRPLAS